jgi:predicted dehydrogenase
MKWSILGAGNISNIFCENLLKQRNSKIFSISSLDKNKLKFFGDKFNISKDLRFNNYADVLDLNSDVVYIGLINSLHKKIIINLAKKKLNILVEKPSFLSVKDFDETAGIIQNEKILFVESMMNLHHPQTHEVFKLIKSGEIGKITGFDHKFGFDIRRKFLRLIKRNINFLNRLTDPRLGGGAINDIGCYGISFANKLALINGSQKIVKIKKNVKKGKTGVDENSEISISYENNFEVNLEVSIIRNLGCEAVITGTEGKIIIPNLVKPKENYKIIVKKKTHKELNFNAQNLFSYISNDVERYLNKGLKEADNYGLKLSEIRNNLSLLDKWKD